MVQPRNARGEKRHTPHPAVSAKDFIRFQPPELARRPSSTRPRVWVALGKTLPRSTSHFSGGLAAAQKRTTGGSSDSVGHPLPKQLAKTSCSLRTTKTEFHAKGSFPASHQINLGMLDATWLAQTSVSALSSKRKHGAAPKSQGREGVQRRSLFRMFGQKSSSASYCRNPCADH